LPLLFPSLIVPNPKCFNASNARNANATPDLPAPNNFLFEISDTVITLEFILVKTFFTISITEAE
jgi:hypothetical protein